MKKLGLLGALFLAAGLAVAQTSRLPEEVCGATLRDLSGSLFLEPLAGADRYRIHFLDVTDPANPEELSTLEVTGVQYFTPAHVEGIRYGRVYRVTVDGQAAGSWTEGDPCILYTPAFPHSRLEESHCGTTLSSLTSQLGVQKVPGASDYQLRIEDENREVVSESPWPARRRGRPLERAMPDRYPVSLTMKS